MKKTLALLLAVFMLFGLLPVSAMAEDDFQSVYNTAKAWVDNSDNNLSWAEESDLDFESLPDYYDDLYNFSFSDGVLDIEVIGDGENNDSWYSKLFEEHNGNTYMNFMIQNSNSLLDGYESAASIEGTGNSFFEEGKNMLEGNFKSGFNTIFFARTAKVSNFQSNGKCIIPIQYESKYTLIGLYDEEQNSYSYKIYVTHVHSSESATAFVINENYVPDERIHPNFNGAAKDYLTSTSFQGNVTIRYTGTKNILEDIIENLKSTDNYNRTVDIVVSAPDGYQNENGEEEVIHFTCMEDGKLNKNPSEYRIVWENKNNSEDHYSEKIVIKFDSPIKNEKTWMDDVASPTDESRIIYKYRENDGEYKEITQDQLYSMTNMNIIKEGNGLLHLTYNNEAEVTVWKYHDIIAEITPPEGAVEYTIYGSENNVWAEEENEYFYNEAVNLLSNDEPIDPDEYPAAINIQQFNELTIGGVTTIHYSNHTDGNNIIIVYWYNGSGEIIKKDYLYTYADDYFYLLKDSVKTNTDDALNSDNIAICLDGIDPIQSVSNQDMICQLFPQESDDNKHYYVKIDVSPKHDKLVQGQKYTVFFPIDCFGFDSNAEAKAAGYIPVIQHLDEQNYVKERILGEYTEQGKKVAFSVTSFSPILVGAEKPGNFYIVSDREVYTKTFDRISLAVQNVSRNETILIMNSGTNVVRGNKTFKVKTYNEDIKTILIAEDGFELYVDGNKVDKIEIGAEEKCITVKKKTNNNGHNTIKDKDTGSTIIGENTQDIAVPSDEKNPNTGAEKYVGIVMATAVIASAGILLSKKK